MRTLGWGYSLSIPQRGQSYQAQVLTSRKRALLNRQMEFGKNIGIYKVRHFEFFSLHFILIHQHTFYILLSEYLQHLEACSPFSRNYLLTHLRLPECGVCEVGELTKLISVSSVSVDKASCSIDGILVGSGTFLKPAWNVPHDKLSETNTQFKLQPPVNIFLRLLQSQRKFESSSHRQVSCSTRSGQRTIKL